MDTFEFFLTFYGLILGLSVVELLSGVARMVDQGHRLRVGWLTPALAVFLALDITDFWGSTWALFREAPRSYALYVLSLVISGLFYLGTYLAFPRHVTDGASLTEHYWARRKWILSSVLLAKLLVHATAATLITSNEGKVAAGAWLSAGLFALLAIPAIALPRGRLAAGALVLLLLFTLAHVVQSAIVLISGPPWPVLLAA